MDVIYFLNERINFIRRLYDRATEPFIEVKRKIEAGEKPYEPPYSEDGEPPFLTEWLEADESLQVLGHTCVSMLCAALHLYLATWESQLGKRVVEAFRQDFKNGWLNGYRSYFAKCFGIRFEEGSADLSLVEELVLARNRIQHPDSITSQKPSYSDTDLSRLKRPFFVDEVEIGLFGEEGGDERQWLLPPTVHVTREKLEAAIVQVEKFANWLEEQIALKRPA